MNVLIIGATGYLGTSIAEAVVRHGYQVTATARSPHAAETLRARGYAVVDADASNPRSLFGPARASDAIVYCVNVTGADQFAVDTHALTQLVEAAKHSPKRIAYTSGVWIYGSTGDAPAGEDAPHFPATLVARRPELERIVLASAHEGVLATVVRPGIVYGRNGGIPEMFVTSARERGAATIVGDGTNHWPAIHVDDLGELFALALERAPIASIYNAADDSAFTVREIAEAASRGAGKNGATTLLPLEQARLVMGDFAEALALDQRISSAHARAELGWKPNAPSIVEDLERGSYATTQTPAGG